MNSFKNILILLVFAATVQCITKQCLLELGKLAADLSKLQIGVQTGNVIAIVKLTIKTSKQIKQAKLACDQPQLQLNSLDITSIKKCLNSTNAFFSDFKIIAEELQQGQDYLDHAFIDQIVTLANQVEPLLEICAIPTQQWNSYLPKECIDILGILANDVSTLRDVKDKKTALVKALLKFKKDEKIAKDVCPFLEK